jgi:ubiquinone/menaquinone biosynthesis C-methylase UbiE
MPPSANSRADLEAMYLSPAEGFRRLADTYDTRLSGNPLLVVEASAALRALPGMAGAHIADIGCGTGRYTFQLARLGAERVTGVDIAPEMLENAVRKARRMTDLTDVIQWERGDIYETLPFADNMLDGVLCGLVLSFLPDLPPAFRELARVLRSDGWLVISDYHPHGLCAARAESLAVGRKDNAPYLRFTSANGEECRIAQTPHTIGDYFEAAREAGLALEHLAEPAADRRLAGTYGAGLHQTLGIPLALAMRFRKRNSP